VDIRTARLGGRPVNRGDLDYVVSMDTNWSVQKTLFGKLSGRVESQQRLERWVRIWETQGFGFWIFSNTRGEVIGHAGIFNSPREEGSIEVGYALKPAHWGKGYAMEMAMVSLDVAFVTFALPRIIAIAAPENIASRRVLEKCGMALDREFVSTQSLPSVRYSAARNDWIRWRSQASP